MLAGLQWVIDNKDRYNIRIVNISVGTVSDNSIDESSVLVKGVNAAWDSGLIVVVAAGNNGPKPMSITTPGISRKIITVGASDDNIAVNIHGDKVSDYSGRGPTYSCIKKPDIVAPGSNILSCSNATGRRGRVRGDDYVEKSGTSMSTPIVSGAIALLLSVYPEMTNKDVKIKLRDSGADLGYTQEKQGWGMLNIERLLN